MNQYFAYIRVSSARQGEQGVSLPEQREAIERYAQRNQLQVSRWYEEQETAAKRGRPIFGEMMKLLRRRAAAGIIIHKIDRSARNLRDWADLGELIDQGIEVHFANESLDLSSRGGRLSADIQAVVAADYIRNLREEAKKGFYGRLKQGYYPMPAPVGYVDAGAAQPKIPDPQTGSLVRKAFELYATGRYNLITLGDELCRMGLRKPSGSKYGENRLSEMLNNSFYYGVIHIKKTEQYFTGVHEPLISKRLFDTVQAVLHGKTNTAVHKHDFLYRRRLTCKNCTYSLIGERQKGLVYYRCHLPQCPLTCVREETVEHAILAQLFRLQFSTNERRFLRQELEHLRENESTEREKTISGLKLRLSHTEDRLARLTDAYIDQLIERDLFEERKKALLSERQDIEDQLRQWRSGKRDCAAELAIFLERADGAHLAYKNALVHEKRDLLDSFTSNRLIDRKTPIIMLNAPFQAISHRPPCKDGDPRRDILRTWRPILRTLVPLLAISGSSLITQEAA